MIFIDSYLPGSRGGGPITSISNLANLLEDDIEILICTKNHDFGDLKPYTNIINDQIIDFEGYKIIYLSKFNLRNFLKTIIEYNPEILYLNSFFSKTTIKVMLLNIYRVKKHLIISPRGELQKNALKLKKTKKMIFLYLYRLFNLNKNIIFHSTSNIETKRIINSLRISKERIRTISNVPSSNFSQPLEKNSKELRIIFISRISPKKNLHFAIEILMQVKGNIIFDIYGPIEDVNYWKRCMSLISKLPKNINAEYRGNVDRKYVTKKMREYNVFLFPTLSENYGHVIVEAMQAGLIPIISDQTPWVNLDGESAGWNIKLSDKGSYVSIVENLCTYTNDEFLDLSGSVISYIERRIDTNLLKESYTNLFETIK